MKRFVFETEQLFLTAVRLFFYSLKGGNSCVVCGEHTSCLPVCNRCEQRCFSFPAAWDRARCGLCGKALVSAQGKCVRCRSGNVLAHVDRVFPLFSYRLWNKTLLFDWKIRGERCLSAFFAGKIAFFLRSMNLASVVVVPVPPRKGKIREKGWDQIDELARFLRWRYGFRILSVLRRGTRQEQKKLDRDGRFSHIKNAYALRPQRQLSRILKPFGNVMPEEVCLVDDVSTTGSTLESCSAVLKSAGVRKVYAVTLFTVE